MSTQLIVHKSGPPQQLIHCAHMNELKMRVTELVSEL